MATHSGTNQRPSDAVIKLADGRNLSYREYGSSTGKPIFYFHGSQSSRLEWLPDDSIADSLGVRIIAVDRPGHGLSDFQPKRQMLDWPQDVVALADKLGIDQFGVMGMSAGGPYVLVCAYKIAHRLTHATIISSFAPQDQKEIADSLPPQIRTMMTMARTAPWLISLMSIFLSQTAKSNPEKALDGFVKMMSAPDQALLAQPAIKAIFPAMFSEAYRLGGRGPAWELSGILVRPWAFQLQDIAMPVSLWQGEVDQNVPVAWGRYLARVIPNCKAHFLPNEGHLLIFNHLENILTEMLA